MLFSAFAVVGVIGFVVDATLFQILYTTFGGYVLPRLVATAIAIVVTWYLHRRFVFRTSKTTAALAEFVKYVTVQSGGIVTNLAIYALLLSVFIPLRSIPVVAVAAGSLCAMVLNFVGAKRWAFAKTSDNESGHD